jgi:hypothetical protein
MTVKPCNRCGEEIEMRLDNMGKWFPANPVTGQRHECPKPAPSAQQPAANPDTIPTIEGQIVGIDYDKRLIRIKDIAGNTTLISWPASRDESFKKQKEWWFVRLTGEYIDHSFVPSDVVYWKKPDNWPKSERQGYGGKPRNERLIAFLALHRAAVSAFPISSSQDYERTMAVIYAQAARDTERAMKDFGGA